MQPYEQQLYSGCVRRVPPTAPRRLILSLVIPFRAWPITICGRTPATHFGGGLSTSGYFPATLADRFDQAGAVIAHRVDRRRNLSGVHRAGFRKPHQLAS